MAIAYDNSTWYTGTAASSYMLSYAMGTVANGIIFAGINCVNGVTISSVAFNSDALTAVAASITDSASVRMQMFYLVNPDSGTHNMVVTFSGTSGHDTVVASYSGVDQADPIDAVYATWDGATLNTQVYSKSLTTTETNTWIVWQSNNFSGDTGLTGISGTTKRQSYPGGAGNFGTIWSDKSAPSTGSNQLDLQATTVAQGDWYGNILTAINEAPASGPANLKTRDGVAKASIKTINGIAIASVKTLNGVS